MFQSACYKLVLVCERGQRDRSATENWKEVLRVESFERVRHCLTETKSSLRCQLSRNYWVLMLPEKMKPIVKWPFCMKNLKATVGLRQFATGSDSDRFALPLATLIIVNLKAFMSLPVYEFAILVIISSRCLWLTTTLHRSQSISSSGRAYVQYRASGYLWRFVGRNWYV